MTAPLVPQGLTPQPAPTPRAISRGEYDYLRRQAMHILANNGSEEDVLRFLETEGQRMPRRIGNEQPETEMPSNLRGLSMRALQGITFGFGDEAMGALLGIITGEGARGGIDTYRREMNAWSEQHKGVGLLAELGGAVLTGNIAVKGARAALARIGFRGASRVAAPLAAAPLKGAAQAVARAAGPTTGQRILMGVRQGAGFGAAFGAGNTQGDLSDRTKGAILGSLTGAAIAGAVGGVGTAIGTVTRPAARAATNWSRALQERLPGVGTPEQRARELLVRAFVQDGLTVQEAVRRAATMQQQGLRPSLLDVAGDETLKLAQETVRRRTPAKQKLVETLLGRQAEQGERLNTALFERIFRGGKLGLRNVEEVQTQLHTARRQLSAPAYQQAYQEVVEVTPRLRQILSNRAFRQAYAVGKQIADDEAIAGIGIGPDIPILPNIQGALGASTREAAVAVDNIAARLFPKTLPVRALDYTKRGLDTMIRRGYKSGGMDATRARALRTTREEMLQIVDTQVPTFAQARAIYRGFSEADEALQLGREVLSMSPDKVRATMHALHPQERDFFRLGAADAISQRVNGASEHADVARQFFGGRLFGGSSAQGERIRALFPESPEVADDFLRMVAGEARISYTNRIGRTQPGTTLQQVEQSFEGAAPPVIRGGGLQTGAVLTGASFLRSGVQRLRMGWTNDVTDELSLLFLKGIDNPNELYTVLDQLATLATHNTDKTLRASGLASGFLAGHMFN